MRRANARSFRPSSPPRSIIITLLALAPLFHNLPNAVLGAIVIASVIGLMDVPELKRFYGSNRIDFVLAMVAMFGVLTTDVLTGLLIAVFLSLLIILYRASRPHLAVLGKVPGQTATYGDVARHPENVHVPGLLIVRLDAPRYFLNATWPGQDPISRLPSRRPRPSSSTWAPAQIWISPAWTCSRTWSANWTKPASTCSWPGARPTCPRPPER